MHGDSQRTFNQALMAPDQMAVALVRQVGNNLEVARKVLTGLGLKYGEEDFIAVRVSDKPGAAGKNVAVRNITPPVRFCS